jgi:C4-dicarboxylate transporter DctM subunit
LSIGLITAIAVGTFLVLAMLEVPIALALGFGGLLGVMLLQNINVAGSVAAQIPFDSTASYSLFCVPMFVLLGALVTNAGIGERIFRSANLLVRRLPGGLAATTVLAISVFSGISGSSSADVATFGRIAVTEMRRHGYRGPYAAAVVAAAGTFAVLIPPSIVLVLYAIIASLPIGAMILAGVIPGLISCAALTVFVIVNAYLQRRNAEAAPELATPGAGARGDGTGAAVERSMPAAAAGAVAGSAGGESFSRDSGMASTVRSDFMGLVYAGILFVIVVGGIYTGVFTATEAGAVGAAASFVIAVLVATPKSSLPTLIGSALTETARVTSMIFLLLIGGAIFSYFIAAANLPATITEWVLGLPVSPKVVVALFLLLLIPLGMFLDGLSILLIMVPVAAPIIEKLGFDGIWFGILVVKLIEIGLITPPVGLNVFIISGLVKDLSVTSVFRASIPFVVLDLAITTVFFFVPGIITWLPNIAGAR